MHRKDEVDVSLCDVAKVRLFSCFLNYFYFTASVLSLSTLSLGSANNYRDRRLLN